MVTVFKASCICQSHYNKGNHRFPGKDEGVKVSKVITKSWPATCSLKGQMSLCPPNHLEPALNQVTGEHAHEIQIYSHSHIRYNNLSIVCLNFPILLLLSHILRVNVKSYHAISLSCAPVGQPWDATTVQSLTSRWYYHTIGTLQIRPDFLFFYVYKPHAMFSFIRS